MDLIGSLDRAQNWLFHSGIYILTPTDPNCGAVYSHYDRKKKRHELLYAEVTGYVISLLRYLSTRTPDLKLLNAAKASGEWLLRWAGGTDGVIALGIWDGKAIREAYTFDNGICCKGLLALYELTGDQRYLDSADRIADWIVRNAVTDEGSVRPVFHVDAGTFVEDPSLWYKMSGSFHAKIAMPLIQLCGIRSDDRIRNAATKILGWITRQQRSDGSFPANKDTTLVNLHFHCYTTEALLYAFACWNEEKFFSAAEKAVNWIASVQRPDGMLPRWHGKGTMKERGADIQAQAARVFILMHMLTRRRDLASGARSALRFLLGMQGDGQDARVNGGFFEGEVHKYRFLRRETPYMSSWATMFAIHALSLMDVLDTGDFFVESKSLF